MIYHYEIIHPADELPVKAFIHSVSEIKLHWHRQLEFLMVLEGSVKINIEGKQYVMQAGDFFFINCNQVHNILSTGQHNLLLAVQINPSFYAGIYPHFDEVFFESHSFFPGESARLRADKIKNYLAQIVWQISRQQPGYRAQVGSNLHLLAGQLINYPFYRVEDIKDKTTDEDLARLQRIIDYVNQNLHRKITLKEIGAVEHLSYYYVSRFIRDKLGLSFQDYLNYVRLQKATRLLLNGDKSIEEVAFATGFATAAAFHKAFKKQFGLTPGEYKEDTFNRYIKFDPSQICLIPNRDASGQPDIFLTDTAAKSTTSRTYLDVDRQAALKTLFNYLDLKPDLQAAAHEPQPVALAQNITATAHAPDKGISNNFYWRRLTSFARAAEGLRANWQQQLQELQTEIGFEQIRFHGIFSDDMMIYQTDFSGNVVYNWTYVDLLLDNLLANNIKPFLELGFMPKELARSGETVFWWNAYIAPPKDIAKWNHLVDAFVRHCQNRYGADEVASWYFEVWNEPELENVFWAGTKEEYFDFFRHTAQTIKAVSPASPVGGPAVAHQKIMDSTWLDEFLVYCRDYKVPLDFVSLHIYPERYPENLDLTDLLQKYQDESLSPKEKAQLIGDIKYIYHGPDHTRSILQSARTKIRNKLGYLPRLCITEWNASAFHRNLIHDTAYVATFILHHVMRCQGLADMLAYWTFTDINEENPLGQQHFHGNFGLMNKDGIKKAAYFAYYLLAKLGDRILASGNEHIITKNSSGVQILVYNYTYFDPLFLSGDTSLIATTDRYRVFEDKPQLKVTVRITGVTGDYKITRYRLNREHGSAYDLWVKTGAPEQMTAEEIKYLQNHSYPQMLVEQITLDGEYQDQITVPMHGAELVLLQKIR